jgi:hypothetical protein
MSNDFDFDLPPDQWNVLKEIRSPVTRDGMTKTHVVEDLIRLGLVAINDGLPVMTPLGRTVLVRGSCRLLDLAS